MYIMCVRDDGFVILDNAFVVHCHRTQSGHQTHGSIDEERDHVVTTQSTFVSNHVLPEYKILFGNKNSCTV